MDTYKNARSGILFVFAPPMPSTFPAPPILKTLPTLPMLRMLPVLPILRMLPALPMLKMLPELKSEKRHRKPPKLKMLRNDHLDAIESADFWDVIVDIIFLLLCRIGKFNFIVSYRRFINRYNQKSDTAREFDRVKILHTPSRNSLL